MTLTVALTTVAAISAAADTAPPASARLRGLAIEESLAGEERLPQALAAARLDKPPFPLFLHLLVPRASVEPEPGVYAFEALERRVAAAQAAGAEVLVTLGGLPRAVADAEPFRQLLAALGERGRGRVRAYILGDPALDEGRPEPREYAFLVKLAAVELRSADPAVRLVEGHAAALDPAWLDALYREETAAYLDGVALRAPADGDGARFPDRVAGVRSALDRLDPTAELIVTGAELGEEARDGASRMVARMIENLAGGATLTACAGGAKALAAALEAASAISDLIGDEVVTLNQAASALRLTSGGEDRTNVTPHYLLFDVKTGSTLIAYWAAPGPVTTLEVEIGVASSAPPVLRDPARRKRGRAKEFRRDGRARVSHATVPVLDRPLVLEFAGSAEEPSGALTVAGEVGPSVEEIVARYQASQAARANALESYAASALTEIHFRPSATDAGYDVVTDSRFYWDREGMEWEELSFQLNGAKWGSNRPSFPLLQAEKVLSLPLRLQLDRDYTYRLEGADEVTGQSTYVVSFEPVAATRSLYRGRIWIDQSNFAGLKIQAVQTNVAPPVASNEEIQIFEPVAGAGGKAVHLLTRLTSRQLILIAGRTVAVEKTVRFSDFVVNAPDFTARREAARASDHIMLRDTDQGLRYFVKRGGLRVVSDQLTTNAKAIAFGTIIDPTYDYPLPIGGLNYLNFDFLHRDMQVAVLFGGVLGFGNVQKPRLFGSRLDASADFFAIALKGEDRVYDVDGEIDGERLRVRPLTAGLNLGWQVTDFMKLTGSYQFRYDHYERDDQTDPGFVPPTSTASNSLLAGWELKRGGFGLTAAGSWSRRASWRPWGDLASFDPDTQSYLKYNVALGKDFFFKTFQKIRVDLAYYGGSRLDRFSKYQMGLFDETKMHGVPSAAVRFQDLILSRASYTFNLLEQFRFELFLDQGFGVDRDRSDKRVSVTGVGFGLSLKGPWNTLVRGEVGKSFLPDAYRGSGSVTGQILFLKPL